MSDLSDSKKQEIEEELRKRIRPLITETLDGDSSLYWRFLKARNYNVDAAELMLKNHIQWRQQTEIDVILQQYKPTELLLSDYLPITLLGFTENGYPVVYGHMSQFDVPGLLKCATKHEIVKYIVYFLENVLSAMELNNKEKGLEVKQWIFILNFEDFPLSTATHKPSLEYFINLALTYDANYPERLHSAYFINASVYFTVFWKILKSFLSPATIQKINIFGKEGWRDELIDRFGTEILPDILLGENVISSAKRVEKPKVRLGGKVPQTYYQWKNQSACTRIQGARKITVPRKGKEEVTLTVDADDSVIEWEFCIASGDIGLSLVYVGDEREILIPRRRVKTEDEAESGMIKCGRLGKYVLEFDNTHSWVHSKEIYCKTGVKKLPVKTD